MIPVLKIMACVWVPIKLPKTSQDQPRVTYDQHVRCWQRFWREFPASLRLWRFLRAQLPGTEKTINSMMRSYTIGPNRPQPLHAAAVAPGKSGQFQTCAIFFVFQWDSTRKLFKILGMNGLIQPTSLNSHWLGLNLGIITWFNFLANKPQAL